jgi:Ulp1 family protease
MVPICEAEHWSLAIIGNPGLVKSVLDEHVELLKSGHYNDLVEQYKLEERKRIEECKLKLQERKRLKEELIA